MTVSKELLQEAVRLHGHLGPFLALGLRMGVCAKRILRGKPRSCEVEAIDKKPYICVVDGIRAIVGSDVAIRGREAGVAATFHGPGGEMVKLVVRGPVLQKYAGVPWEKCEEHAAEVLQESEENLLEAAAFKP